MQNAMGTQKRVILLRPVHGRVGGTGHLRVCEGPSSGQPELH